MSRYRREIDTQCCNAWMNGIRTINGQYPDDNRDFDINAGNGIRIEPATGGITIINDAATSSFIEGDNIEITPSGDDLVIGLVSDPHVSGNLQVDGTTTLNDTLQVNADIIQNGAAYETHAEKVYTTNDYIITRDGAVSALSPGDYSGFQVKKYDGTNDGRLVIDNSGVARVGDVGDEQPLLTRDESVNMNNGALLIWDNTDQRAETVAGNIGSDTKPIKIVNGVATEVTSQLGLYSDGARIDIPSTVNITSANSWITITNAVPNISLNNPYFANDNNGGITILQAGWYNITLTLSASGTGYESISAGGNRHQNKVSGTNISINVYLNLNSTVNVGIYRNATGNISVDQYNSLNRLTIARL